MVSPEDLFKASTQLLSVKMGFKLRSYESGVNVVERADLTDRVILEKVLSHFKANTTLTATKLAHVTGLSVIVAKEYLLLSERSGGICRDDSINGLVFYQNCLI